ncbi:MAG: tetratricopeptide repeat protein [Phycisphaerae bacterium]
MAAVVLCAACGCSAQGQGQTAQAGPGTSAQPTPAPLPAKALLKLDELKPPLATRPTATSAPTTRPLSPQAAAALAEAEKCLAAKPTPDTMEAIRYLERAISFDPDSVKIRRTLGLAYASIQDYGKAVNHLRYAVKAAPDDLESHLLLANVLMFQKANEDAIAAFRTALACSDARPENPLTAEALLHLGELLQKEGYYTAALECFTRLEGMIEKYGSAYTSRAALKELVLRPERLQTVRGQLLTDLRRPSEAIDPLQKAYDSNHTDLTAARLLLEALIAVKQYDRAEKLLVELAGEGSQGPQLSMLAQSLCRAAGDPAMPNRIWEAFRKKNAVNAPLAVALAAISERLGRDDQARAILQAVAEQMPGNMSVASALAGLLARQGKPEAALDVLVKAVAASPRNVTGVGEGVRQVLAASLTDAKEKEFIDSARASAGADKYAMLYVAGMIAQARGQYDQAVDLFGQTIDARRDFLPAYEGIVDVDLAQDLYDKAANAVAGLPRQDYFASYLLGKIKLARGQTAAAIKDLEACRKADEKFVPACLALAEAYVRERRGDTAASVLKSVLNTEDPRVYRLLFQTYLAGRQYRDAQAVIGMSIERSPQSLQGLIMLAELNMAIGQHLAARSIVAQLLEQAPDSVDVNLLAAREEVAAAGGLVSKPQYDVAMKRLDAVLRLDPRNIDAQRFKAQLAGQPGLFAQAAETWKNLRQQYPAETEFGVNYAMALMLARKYDLAAQTAEELLAGMTTDTPDRQALRTTFIELQLKLKNYAKAEELVQKWINEENAKADNAKDLARIRGYQGLLLTIYEAAKDPASCEKAVKAIDEWLPKADARAKARLYQQKVQFLCLAKQYDKAVEYVNGLIKQKVKPETDIPRGALIVELREAKQFDKAQAALDEWIKAGGSADLLESYRVLKIELYGQAGKLDEAQKVADACIAQAPTAVAPRQALIDVLADPAHKKYDQALALVDGWLAKVPASAPATAPATKPAPTPTPRPPIRPFPGPGPGPGPGPATAPAKVVIELGPWLRQTKVWVLLKAGKFGDALVTADKYLKDDPKDVRLLNLKSSCLSELKRPKESMAVLEEVYKLNPNDSMANNNLGYVYAEQGVNLDKAHEMLRRALGEKPSDPSFLDSLGWILYRQGRFNEAGSVFRELLTLLEGREADEGRAVIYDHAGDAYWRLGWAQKAVELWNKAVELAGKDKSPTPEDKQVQSSAQAKVKAAQSGKAPAVMLTAEGK